RLENQDWLENPSVLKIYGLLNDGRNKKSLFVGGCVRNSILGLAVEDIDMATIMTPQEVVEILEQKGVKVIPTGLDHGTVTAVIDGRAFEITTLRKDVQTDGRHASVAYTDDWLEDARRRDFTMNTLLADINGQVYDPLEQGYVDLKKGRVAFVGEAAKRIEEDYLRILRFFRFHALYGVGKADAVALKACKDGAQNIRKLSAERITQEFLKILMTDNAQETLILMFENNILSEFFVSENQMILFRDFCNFQKRYGLIALSSRLYVLANLDKEHLRNILELLLIPKVFLKDIQAIDQILQLPDLDKDQAVKVAVYKYGRVPAAQALMIELVLDRVMNGYAPKALEIIQSWDVPDFPISGEDLKKAGLKPGPALGQALSRLEEQWIKSGFQEEKETLLKAV
ncbi:MAG: CCA tRNA nucleotidyltransferase, partial [Alphaproteobacteria bacterium]